VTVGLVLTIANKNLSTWSLRPWLALVQAEIAFEERVVLFEAPDWHETVGSPSGRVPLLRDGETVVWDSLAICEYLAELRPTLWPADRAVRAEARATAAEMHSGFAAMRSDLSNDIRARFPRKTLSHETQRDVDRVQAIWARALARSGGPFLYGTFSIADAMFAPVVFRFRTYDVPLDASARAYSETMLALPAMQRWEREAVAEPIAKGADPTSAQQAWAVIFANQLKDASGYAETAHAMEELARKQPGFLGIDSARGDDGFGITVSYWDSREAIARWKAMAEHRKAQAVGRERFYERYELRVCSVERGYKFP
jgi:glutathione S-transferase